jgi:hypothetical protein
VAVGALPDRPEARTVHNKVRKMVGIKVVNEFLI